MIIGTDICKHEYQSKFYYTSNKKLKKTYCHGYKKYKSVPKMDMCDIIYNLWRLV